MPDEPAAGPDRELARLIRRSRLLDPILKRQWLSVLPHLAPADQDRLREILRSEPTEPARTPPPSA